MPNSKDIRTRPETQASHRWTQPTGTLGALVAAAEGRAEALAPDIGKLERQVGSAAAAPSLMSALSGLSVSVIAEVKRASPSKGTIRPEIDASTQSIAYQRGGAAAISVLTEPDRFGGSTADLVAAARATGLPILKKDFHVSRAQLLEARALGASAALLIVRAVAPARFRELVADAREMELEIVAEVRSRAELETALSAGCRIIGVNNRNLETLVIEAGTVEALIPSIPQSCAAIAESGYSDRAGIEAAANAGADAVLVGSSLSASDDPTQAVRGLCGVMKVPRRG